MSSPTNADAIESLVTQHGALPSWATAAYLEESKDRSAIIGILFVASLVLCVSLLRCYARLVLSRTYGLDDWLALASLILFLAFVSLCIVLIHLGSGRHFLYIQYVLDNAQINETEVLDFVAHIIYTSALIICRLSGLAFYARICRGSGKMLWHIRGAAVFMVVAYIPQLLLIVFHCLPVTGTWPYSFQPEVNRYTCIDWGTVYVTHSVVSLLCDLILFTIPAFIIRELHLSPGRKFKLSLVLMPGLLVIAVTGARMYLVVVGQWTADESWSYDDLLSVEVAEIGTTLIALSIPALKPFVGNLFSFLDRADSGGLGRPRRSSPKRRGTDSDGRVELKQRSSKPAVDKMTTLSPGSSACGSQERDDYGFGPKDVQYSVSACHAPMRRGTSGQSTNPRQANIQRQVEILVTRT